MGTLHPKKRRIKRIRNIKRIRKERKVEKDVPILPLAENLERRRKNKKKIKSTGTNPNPKAGLEAEKKNKNTDRKDHPSKTLLNLPLLSLKPKNSINSKEPKR